MTKHVIENLGDDITEMKLETKYYKQNKQCNIISSIIIKPAKKITKSTHAEGTTKVTLENKLQRESTIFNGKSKFKYY